MSARITGEALATIPACRAILQQSNTEITAELSETEVEMPNALLRRVFANVEAMEVRSALSSYQGKTKDVA
jgi:hypothetical protein